MKNLVLLLILLISPALYASEGHEGGNGGDAFQIDHSSVITWDEVERGKPFHPAQEEAYVHIDKQIKEIEKNLPYLAKLLRDNFERPRLQWYFVNPPLKEVNDEGNTPLVLTYEKIQVALQAENEVFIHESTWNKLNRKSQAYLLAHEVVRHLAQKLLKSHLQEINIFVCQDKNGQEFRFKEYFHKDGSKVSKNKPYGCPKKRTKYLEYGKEYFTLDITGESVRKITGSLMNPSIALFDREALIENLLNFIRHRSIERVDSKALDLYSTLLLESGGFWHYRNQRSEWSYAIHKVRLDDKLRAQCLLLGYKVKLTSQRKAPITTYEFDIVAPPEHQLGEWDHLTRFTIHGTWTHRAKIRGTYEPKIKKELRLYDDSKVLNLFIKKARESVQTITLDLFKEKVEQGMCPQSDYDRIVNYLIENQ